MQQRDEERQVTHSRSTGSHGARRMAGGAAAVALALFGTIALGAGCGDEDQTKFPVGGAGGTAGTGGRGGTGGTAGTGGAAGTAGTAGTAGNAGTGGSAGNAGTGGSAGNAGTAGTGGSGGEAPDAGGDAAVDSGPTGFPFPPNRALTVEEMGFYICGREDELADCNSVDGCSGLITGFLGFVQENFETECANDTLAFYECMARQDTNSFRCVGDPLQGDFSLFSLDYDDGPGEDFGSNGCEAEEAEFIIAQTGSGCD